jgi:O-antigen/teichoic acid export membrane protein
MRRHLRIDVSVVRPLLAYGGWVTLSNIVGATLTYLDRFAIGAVMSSAQVGYYTAPYDTVTRLWVIPSSVVSALFPAVSASSARQESGIVSDLAGPPIKYMLLLVGPIAGVLMVCAPDILGWWLGPAFAARSVAVLQLLSVGVLLNCVGFVPFSILQAIGRADLPPKFYFAELVLYVPLLFFLLARFGIAGAAAAWTARVALDSAILSAACASLSPLFWRSLREHRVFVTASAVVVLWAVIASAHMLSDGRALWQISVAGAAVAAFAAAAWGALLSDDERHDLIGLARSWQRA